MNIVLEIVKELESLLWFIVIVVALYIVLKCYCIPKMQLKHERQMKVDAHNREKEWYFIKRTEKPIDSVKELSECQAQLDEFKKKEKELNERTKSLNKEKDEFEKKVLQTKIKAYEEIIKTINK